MDPDPNTNSESFIRRFRAGDDAALEALMRRCYPRVECIVSIRLGPALRAKEDVADVVQDVFVRILKGLEHYEPRRGSSWIDWVARLCENEIRNHARAARTKKRGGELEREVRRLADSAASWDVAAESTGIADRAATREQVEKLYRCIDQLDETHRDVILLAIAGHSWSGIAEMLGRPTPEACGELHRRARMELLRIMAKEGLSG